MLKGNNEDGLFTVENGHLCLSKLWTDERGLARCHRYDTTRYAPLCLVRCLPYGAQELVAVSDFESNVHIISLKNDEF